MMKSSWVSTARLYCFISNSSSSILFLDMASWNSIVRVTLRTFYRNTWLELIGVFDCSGHQALTLATSQPSQSHDCTSATLPPPCQPHQHFHVQPIGLKPPRMEAPTWCGKHYDFYTWLASTIHLFTFSNSTNTAKTQILLQAMPLEKKMLILQHHRLEQV